MEHHVLRSDKIIFQISQDSLLFQWDLMGEDEDNSSEIGYLKIFMSSLKIKLIISFMLVQLIMFHMVISIFMMKIII